MNTCLAETYAIHLELAIDVFKTQSPALVISLKNFLTVLPNPQCVEDVLTVAIYKLAKTDPDTCRWVLRNAYYLKPEVDLVEVANKLALTKLQKQGFIPNQDYRLESNNRLQISEKAKAGLMLESSPADRLLLEEILLIGD